ncbi:MAG: hypothetical protein AAF493_05815 [Pseudomonadota bacterium]
MSDEKDHPPFGAASGTDPADDLAPPSPPDLRRPGLRNFTAIDDDGRRSGVESPNADLSDTNPPDDDPLGSGLSSTSQDRVDPNRPGQNDAGEGDRSAREDSEIHRVQSNLDDAIDALESLLNQRQQANPGAEADGQYTIPLLDEVVVPNPDAPPLPNPPEWDANAERIARFQPIFDRLASELEVIIQGSIDEALKTANRKIQQRIRNHIAIVLPEILEELENEQAQERDV